MNERINLLHPLFFLCSEDYWNSKYQDLYWSSSSVFIFRLAWYQIYFICKLKNYNWNRIIRKKSFIRIYMNTLEKTNIDIRWGIMRVLRHQLRWALMPMWHCKNLGSYFLACQNKNSGSWFFFLLCFYFFTFFVLKICYWEFLIWFLIKVIEYFVNKE